MAAQLCHTCRRRTSALIHCVTEEIILCLNCDLQRHLEDDAGHVRYRFCEKCLVSPALFLCYDHKTVVCQCCYSLYYNCNTYGHRVEIFNPSPVQQRHDNNKNNPIPEPYVGPQRRERLFEMLCYGNGNCERWMFPVKCETCVQASNAVVYCYQHDHLLCHNCDRILHCPCRTVLPPQHMRFVLCVTCKILSHNFLMGASQFSAPPSQPPAVAEEVSASPSTEPSQQDSNLS